MPYKDPQKKKEWELKHGSERLARRRELRRINSVSNAARPDPAGGVEHNGAAILLPLAMGGVLAAENPKLAMGMGGLTLIVASLYRKGSGWWIAGALLLAFGIIFYAVQRSADTKPDIKTDTCP